MWFVLAYNVTVWIRKSNSGFISYLKQGYKRHYTRYSQLQWETESCVKIKTKLLQKVCKRHEQTTKRPICHIYLPLVYKCMTSQRELAVEGVWASPCLMC